MATTSTGFESANSGPGGAPVHPGVGHDEDDTPVSGVDILASREGINCVWDALQAVDRVFSPPVIEEAGDGGSSPAIDGSSANMLVPPNAMDKKLIDELWRRVKEMRRRRRHQIEEAWKRLGGLAAAEVPPTSEYDQQVRKALRDIAGHALAAVEVTETLALLHIYVPSALTLLETALLWHLTKNERWKISADESFELQESKLMTDIGERCAWPGDLSTEVFRGAGDAANSLTMLVPLTAVCWRSAGDSENSSEARALAEAVLLAASDCAALEEYDGIRSEPSLYGHWSYALHTLKRYHKYWGRWGDALLFLTYHFFGQSLRAP